MVFLLSPLDNIRDHQTKVGEPKKPPSHKTPTPNSLVGLQNAESINLLQETEDSTNFCVLTSHHLLPIAAPAHTSPSSNPIQPKNYLFSQSLGSPACESKPNLQDATDCCYSLTLQVLPFVSPNDLTVAQPTHSCT